MHLLSKFVHKGAPRAAWRGHLIGNVRCVCLSVCLRVCLPVSPFFFLPPSKLFQGVPTVRTSLGLQALFWAVLASPRPVDFLLCLKNKKARALANQIEPCLLMNDKRSRWGRSYQTSSLAQLSVRGDEGCFGAGTDARTLSSLLFLLGLLFSKSAQPAGTWANSQAEHCSE